MNDSWHTYPKVYNLGHAGVKDLLLDEVIVEEKIDGSQFSFGVFVPLDTATPELRVRSKGAIMLVDAPEKMFAPAVETAKALRPLLREGWTYRAEYLSKPKHNTLCYNRIPERHLILFDVNSAQEEYLSYGAKANEAHRLGLEVVPLLHHGRIDSLGFFRTFLERESILGGQKVEGVVVKNYTRFGIDGKALMGKFVSEEFKEVHAGDWKERNPNAKDVVQRIIDDYRTPARWQKAVIHLKELGQWEGSPRDIGTLMRLAQEDVLQECEAEIKERLFLYAKEQIVRGVAAGLPQWYKEQLLKQQFESTP